MKDTVLWQPSEGCLLSVGEVVQGGIAQGAMALERLIRYVSLEQCYSIGLWTYSFA